MFTCPPLLSDCEILKGRNHVLIVFVLPAPNSFILCYVELRKWNIWRRWAWGGRVGKAASKALHYSQAGASNLPWNNPHAPNSQNPNKQMLIWARTHRNTEVFVLWDMDYLPLSFHNSLQEKKVLFKDFKDTHFTLFFSFYLLWWDRKGLYLPVWHITNPGLPVLLLSPNPSFPWS